MRSEYINLHSYMDKTQTSLKKAGLEFLRIIVLAILPILMMSVNAATGEVTINWTLITGTVFLAILKAIDKFIHEHPSTDAKGVLPF